MSNFSGFNRPILHVIVGRTGKKNDTTNNATRKTIKHPFLCVDRPRSRRLSATTSQYYRPQEKVNIMIPQISGTRRRSAGAQFLQALEQQARFTGGGATSYADRLTMSTDNSIYQLLPDAVVSFPFYGGGCRASARLAAEPRLRRWIFTPRGGTGTNGRAR